MATVSQWRVRLGKHDRSKTESSEQNLSVKTIISHNSYSSSKLTNDIALMELSTPAQINYFVSPVCVSGVDVDTGTNCFTTGWGDTLSTGSNLVLRQVTVPIIDQSTCASRDYSGRYMDTTTMICAGYEHGGKDSCQGDSGGPLVCSSRGSWYLTGITSWGFGCAEAFKPGVYTRVVNYVSWLGNNVVNYSTRQEFYTPHRGKTMVENPRRYTVSPVFHGVCYLRIHTAAKTFVLATGALRKM